MNPALRLQWYGEWFERRGRDAFALEFNAPVLISRASLEIEAAAEAGFHTAFMKRTQLTGEMEAARQVPQDERQDEVQDGRQEPRHDGRQEERLSIRAGEVRFIQKAPGAAFADRVGVGRARNADVCLPHSNVSKYHAYFTGTPETGYTLTDADSRNGTWVGNERLTPRTPVPVVDGAKLVFGPYRFTFLSPAAFCETIARRTRK